MGRNFHSHAFLNWPVIYIFSVISVMSMDLFSKLQLYNWQKVCSQNFYFPKRLSSARTKIKAAGVGMIANVRVFFFWRGGGGGGGVDGEGGESRRENSCARSRAPSADLRGGGKSVNRLHNK